MDRPSLAGTPGRPAASPRSRSPRSRALRAAYVAAMVVVGLFAAMTASVFFAGFADYFPLTGAEPEDPSTQPIEIVAASDSCVLNVPEVAPERTRWSPWRTRAGIGS
jgi:hypothetical protein